MNIIENPTYHNVRIVRWNDSNTLGEHPPQQINNNLSVDASFSAFINANPQIESDTIEGNFENSYSVFLPVLYTERVFQEQALERRVEEPFLPPVEEALLERPEEEPLLVVVPSNTNLFQRQRSFNPNVLLRQQDSIQIFLAAFDDLYDIILRQGVTNFGQEACHLVQTVIGFEPSNPTNEIIDFQINRQRFDQEIQQIRPVNGSSSLILWVLATFINAAYKVNSPRPLSNGVWRGVFIDFSDALISTFLKTMALTSYYTSKGQQECPFLFWEWEITAVEKFDRIWEALKKTPKRSNLALRFPF